MDEHPCGVPMSILLVYLALGAGAGVLAGLLGIGGGLVLVAAVHSQLQELQTPHRKKTGAHKTLKATTALLLSLHSTLLCLPASVRVILLQPYLAVTRTWARILLGPRPPQAGMTLHKQQRGAHLQVTRLREKDKTNRMLKIHSVP